MSKQYLDFLEVTFLSFLFYFFAYEIVIARGGGGGSSSSSYVGGDPYISVIVIIFLVYSWHVRKKKIEKTIEVMVKAASFDPVWDKVVITDYVRQTFTRFQEDWSSSNTDSMRTYCTVSFAEKTSLQLTVLQAQGRINRVNNIKIIEIAFVEAVDHLDDFRDKFVVEITAKAEDVLYESSTNKQLFVDNSKFREFWTFIRKGDEWLLDNIGQATASLKMSEKKIENFAKDNGLFFNPDFGWLMLPNKGVIFNDSNFLKSDVNNHVIGRYGNYVIELYTYLPKRNKTRNNFVVAQTILTRKYNNILVRRKHWLWNKSPKGLRLIQTESNDFNKKFCLYAAPADQINSFVLLSPDFMELVYSLPFVLNIEVVDNFLYLYTKSRDKDQFKTMLDILIRACRSIR